ncbi:MAG TPA: tetratricopeptide repeat protein [Steroidobacteraceae bacterium]|nr:tetratricopeptide repeat protein [Steroidobacteraceae bacterium]
MSLPADPGAADPGADRLLERATERHRAGDLAEAQRLYGEVLAAHPHNDLALFRSGLLELQERRAQAAAALIARAAAQAPDNARYQFGLGQALQALARWQEAGAAFRRALELQPSFPDAYIGLAIVLQHGGELAAAAAAYRAALVLEPDNAGALGNLGTVLRAMGDLEQSIRILQAAARLEPGAASHAVNLGAAYCEQRDFSAAEAVLRSALARHPGDADAAFNLGNALRGLARPREALEHYAQAVALRPEHAEAFNNMGNLHRELGDFAAAMAAFDCALRARPDYLTAINNAGCLLRTLGRIDAAEDMLRRGLAIDPRHPALNDNLGNVLKDAGEIEEAIGCYRRALEVDPGNAATHGNLAYALAFHCSQPAPILEECERWGARFAAPLARCAPRPAGDLAPDRRLRIGYVSGDFREHCQSLFTLPLLEHHDARSVEIFCYSSVERPDAWTRRLASLAHAWRDARALDDAALCRLIQQDGIDILVDLNMHMANGRARVFARKPAPVQIAWLAYPGTTGIGAMDYRLSDPRLDPAGFDAHYSERTLRLPDTFWCYHPQSDPVPIGALPAIERGHLTLGCFNNPCKLTDRTLGLWGGVLGALPSARLDLLAPAGRHRERLASRLAAHGIDPARVSFIGYRPRAQYLRAYHEIDFCLDTLPYNGHTTSLDALWMGVPVITRIGETSVGRGGLSQLFHVGLLDLAAASDQAFVASALALANDLGRLDALRRSLRETMTRSPLMDAVRFARNIEDAYRHAWRAERGAPGG